MKMSEEGITAKRKEQTNMRVPYHYTSEMLLVYVAMKCLFTSAVLQALC